MSAREFLLSRWKTRRIPSVSGIKMAADLGLRSHVSSRKLAPLSFRPKGAFLIKKEDDGDGPTRN